MLKSKKVIILKVDGKKYRITEIIEEIEDTTVPTVDLTNDSDSDTSPPPSPLQSPYAPYEPISPQYYPSPTYNTPTSSDNISTQSSVPAGQYVDSSSQHK